VGVGPGGTEGSQQHLQLRIVGVAQPDGVVRPLAGGEQLESVLVQLASGRKVNRAKASEPALEKLVERNSEDREDREAQQRLSVQRPGPSSSVSMATQLVHGVSAAAYHHCGGGDQTLNTQKAALLDPL
jgi:hypothetical protein